MENLVILETEKTPTINFDINGKLRLEGRAIPENAAKFFTPLLEWAKDFHAEDIVIEIKLEYFNTSASKWLLELLKVFESNNRSNKILVKWYYEEGDVDILESGEYFESLLKIPFEYFEYDEF